MGDPVEKYLAHYAAGPIELAAQLGHYTHAIAIPATAEGPELDAAVASVQVHRGRALVVVVLNVRQDARPELLAEHHASAERLRRTYAHRATLGPHAEVRAHPAGDLLLWQEIFPIDEGVGLARRIGLDLLLALRHRRQLASRWLHTTDADVLLPPDYFARTEDAPAAAALIYPFWHLAHDDPWLGDRMQRYEIRMRHLVLGLAWAKSPYAFHTIGSTFAADAHAYAQVRGVPRLLAGEDFYVLGKLAKVGPMHVLGGEPITIDGRPSGRVPFGTGATLRKDDPIGAYDPDLFARLARVVDGLTAAAAHGTSWSAVAPDDVRQTWAGCVHALGVEAALRRIAQTCHRDPAARVRRLHGWFDAFLTRRLLHRWRDHDRPDLSVEDAVSRSPFTRGASGSLQSQRAHLAALEERLDSRRGVPE